MVAAVVSGVCGDQQKKNKQKTESTQNRAVLHHSVYPALARTLSYVILVLACV